MPDSSGIQQLIRQQLEDLHRAGVQQLPVACEMESNPAERIEQNPRPVAAVPADNADLEGAEAMAEVEVAAAIKAGTRLSKKARQELLDEVNVRVRACEKCRELCTTRTQTVFGVGNPASRLVFLGEAPGADEDRLGEPFVGRAGKLLDKILEACTLSRQKVYILNILKCRPPNNRNPAGDEAANCDEFLRAQLDIIRPEYICCLGSVAAQNLLATQETIGKLRGRFHPWRGIQVLATYHPAYLLRNPAAKAEVWKDMQFLMKAMGVELPRAGAR